MLNLKIEVKQFFILYKNDDIEKLKKFYNKLKNDLKEITKTKCKYICTCVLKNVDVETEVEKTTIRAFVNDLRYANLCCNCQYSLLPYNMAAGEKALDHYHPRFNEELTLTTLDMVYGAILALEFGLKRLSDYEIRDMIRQDVINRSGLTKAMIFNEYFNELEL